MRRSPSMVPAETGHDTYLVREDLGRFGRVWRETAEADANHETLIRDLIAPIHQVLGQRRGDEVRHLGAQLELEDRGSSRL